MEGEKNLKYFEYYSRSACHIECDTLLMQERCQCRPYFFKGKAIYITFSTHSTFRLSELEFNNIHCEILSYRGQ